MIEEEKAQYKRFNRDVVPGVNDMEVLSPPQTLSEFADDLCFHRQARFHLNLLHLTSLLNFFNNLKLLSTNSIACYLQLFSGSEALENILLLDINT
ncbi:hypothetical protein Avbf_15950, partial [Armadillidium vulgare]